MLFYVLFVVVLPPCCLFVDCLLLVIVIAIVKPFDPFFLSGCRNGVVTGGCPSASAHGITR
jgi:hypothetical protein